MKEPVWGTVALTGELLLLVLGAGRNAGSGAAAAGGAAGAVPKAEELGIVVGVPGCPSGIPWLVTGAIALYPAWPPESAEVGTVPTALEKGCDAGVGCAIGVGRANGGEVSPAAFDASVTAVGAGTAELAAMVGA